MPYFYIVIQFEEINICEVETEKGLNINNMKSELKSFSLKSTFNQSSKIFKNNRFCVLKDTLKFAISSKTNYTEEQIFKFLNIIKRKFAKLYCNKNLSNFSKKKPVIENSYTERFKPHIMQKAKLFFEKILENENEEDKINDNVGQLQSEMKANVNKIKQNNELMENLVDSTGKMELNSKEMLTNSRRLRNIMENRANSWCSQTNIIAIVGIVIIAIICIFVLIKVL